MPGRLSTLALPENQRRTIDELTEDLDLTAGDSRAKRSAFWTMLTLSAVIASAGVLSDSTATVIGAMIIAPLSTPIMGIALGLAKRDSLTTRRSIRFVAGGSALVIGIGVVFSFVLPGSFDLLGNSQIAGRTSPGLLDLIAAVATGFAGAVALARRDVAAVLPGVAIAISLVPPLAVVGVCLGQGAIGLALGALLLFASNLLALVLAGTIVYAVLGYGEESPAARGGSRRKAYLALGGLMLVVLIPLAANTLVTLLISVWTSRVQEVATTWVSSVPGATVEDVTYSAPTITVKVRTPTGVPPVEELVDDLAGQIPNGIPVVVTTSLGQNFDAGTVGSG